VVVVFGNGLGVEVLNCLVSSTWWTCSARKTYTIRDRVAVERDVGFERGGQWEVGGMAKLEGMPCVGY
jgi:hypothetical protein